MNINDFDYELDEQLIAKYPLKNRTDSRLMRLNRQTGEINHKHFGDILDDLHQGDLLVFNHSKVINARLYGKKSTGGAVELLIERVVSDTEALAHIKASKAPKPGTQIELDAGIWVQVLDRNDALFRLCLIVAPGNEVFNIAHSNAKGHCSLSKEEDRVTFVRDDTNVRHSHAGRNPVQNWFSLLEKIGHVPLPPYIDREDELSDHDRYQTVYAKVDGSVAAPTAGLHFDDALLAKLKAKGIEFGYVTLHVGAGTFQPVRVDNIEDHHMHSEIIDVSADLVEKIKATKARGNRVVAVGTTTVRSLESAALSGELKPMKGETDIFIKPGYEFKVIDALITNFHLPKSTLMMLVSALSSRDHIINAYLEAVSQQYRFFSYGDAMLISDLN